MSSSSTTILDRINIPSPCTADWDSMIGNEEVRFCLHCSKHVNNLSEMTRKRALELVARSKGGLCVRYYRRPDGRIQTSDRDNRLYQIGRRTSRLAAGAFTAVLSLCSGVAAQTGAPTGQAASSGVELQNAYDSARPAAVDLWNGSLSGIVLDPMGAVIPGIKITLRHEETNQERDTISDSDGQYRFQNLGAGTYTLKFEPPPGFQNTEFNSIVLQAGAELKMDHTIGVAVESVTVGGAMVITPDNPLVKAASENDLKTVKSLIAAGSDVNKRDEGTDTTALDEAVTYANREMVRALLDAGAEINARNSRRQTALMRMDEDGTGALVWDLVAAGAKVNIRDEDGDTVLMLSAMFSGTGVLRALMDAGAKINARNKDGETALMKAAETGSLENLRLLIAYGAELNLKNDRGETALKLAKNSGHEEIVELLRAHSAIE